MATDDPYSVLGIRRDASTAEINAAFRNLAKKYHPDLNRNDPSAAAKFGAIREAYNDLKDPASRANYDRSQDQSNEPIFDTPLWEPTAEQLQNIFKMDEIVRQQEINRLCRQYPHLIDFFEKHQPPPKFYPSASYMEEFWRHDDLWRRAEIDRLSSVYGHLREWFAIQEQERTNRSWSEQGNDRNFDLFTTEELDRLQEMRRYVTERNLEEIEFLKRRQTQEENEKKESQKIQPNQDTVLVPHFLKGALAGLSAGFLLGLVVAVLPAWILSGIYGWLAAGRFGQQEAQRALDAGWNAFWVLSLAVAILGSVLGGIAQSRGDWLRNNYSNPEAATRRELFISLSCLILGAAIIVFFVSQQVTAHNELQAKIQQQDDVNLHTNRAVANSRSGQMEAAENEFGIAYKIAADNRILQNQVLVARSNEYTLIQVPAQGPSIPYSVRGQVLFTLGFMTTKGFTFRTGEPGHLYAANRNWVAISSEGKTYTPQSIGAIMNNAGIVFGPYATQDEAAIKLVFESTDGREKHLFITVR